MNFLGMTADVISAPIRYGLEKTAGGKDLELRVQSSQQNCRDLLEEKLDAAFITAIDYAGSSPKLRIIDDLLVSSSGPGQYVIVGFRENLVGLKSTGSFSDTQDYLPLAKLVLSEIYDMRPQWQEISPESSASQALEAYPSVLLEGQRALDFAWKQDHYFDILEIWQDKFELPFVHQLLVIRETQDALPFLETLRTAVDYGLKNLLQVGEQISKDSDFAGSKYLEYLQNYYHYIPSAQDWRGLATYFEYLYYYGFIEHIPGLNFLRK